MDVLNRCFLRCVCTAIISTLLNGKVKVKDKEGVKTFDVKGGVVEMLNNKVIILAEGA